MPPSKLTELLIFDQSMRWNAKEDITAEQYLGLFPDLQNHPEYAIDIVYSEFLMRERLGLHPTIDEYISRFPRYADELKSQEAFHRAMGFSSMDVDTEFPSLAESSEAGVEVTPRQFIQVT